MTARNFVLICAESVVLFFSVKQVDDEFHRMVHQ